MVARLKTSEMQLPRRRKNLGFSMFCQFGNLANSLLLTVYSEGSHVDSRVRGHEKNERKLSKMMSEFMKNVFKSDVEMCMLF